MGHFKNLSRTGCWWVVMLAGLWSADPPAWGRQSGVVHQSSEGRQPPQVVVTFPSADTTSASQATEAAPGSSASQLPLVTRVRHWSEGNTTHVAVDLRSTGEFKYQTGELPNPRRVFVDFFDVRVPSVLVVKSSRLKEGLLRNLRMERYRDGRSRLVIFVTRSCDYQASFVQDSPQTSQLIVDLKPPANPQAQPGTAGISAGEGRSSGSTSPGALLPSVSARPRSEPAKVAPAPGKSPAGAVAQARPPQTPPVAKPLQPRPPRLRQVAAPHEARPNTNGSRSLIRALGLKIGRIVIDAGHGGFDNGTIGPDGLREKDVVLDIALRLGRLLEGRLGTEVVYTRAGDTFVPLEERTNIANQAHADLFVSIHGNSSKDSSVAGVETYYLSFTSSPDALEVAARENAISDKSIAELQDLVKEIALKEKVDESREFAGSVQRALYTELESEEGQSRDRGVRKAPFIVLIGANMPSILAEVSFLSNRGEGRKLLAGQYRQRIAESLFQGIANYVSGLGGLKMSASQAASRSSYLMAIASRGDDLLEFVAANRIFLIIGLLAAAAWNLAHNGTTVPAPGRQRRDGLLPELERAAVTGQGGGYTRQGRTVRRS